MKKYMMIALAVLLFVPSLAFSNTLSFKINYFIPRLEYKSIDYDFMKTEFAQMDFRRRNFEDTSFGVFYEYFFDGRFSLVVGLDTFSKSKAGYYKDFVGYSFEDGDFAYPSDFYGDFVPGHTLDISITPIQLSFKVAPLGRRASFIPYFGGGVSMVLWNLRLRGQIVDFSQPFLDENPDYGPVIYYPITSRDALEGESFGRVSLGYQLFGGAMLPIGNRLTLDAEFKYFHATGKLEKAFQGFEPYNLFDLAGYQISIGINYWF